MSLRTEHLLHLELEVKDMIAGEDPTKPMDSRHYKDFLARLRQVGSMYPAGLHVFKVAGKLEHVKKFPRYEDYQDYAKALFFVRPLSRRVELERLAIDRHAMKTSPEEATDMSMIFQPCCFCRPTFMKKLFYLDVPSFQEPPWIIAAKLFSLPLELAGDCIISADPFVVWDPSLGDPLQNMNITHYYSWTSQSDWSCVVERRSKGNPGDLWVQDRPVQAHAECDWQVMRQWLCHDLWAVPHRVPVPAGRDSDDEQGRGLEECMGTLGSHLFEPSIKGLPMVLFMGSVGQVPGNELQTMQDTTLDSPSSSEVNETEGQDGMHFPALPSSIRNTYTPYTVRNTFIQVPEEDEEEKEEVKGKQQSRSSPARLPQIVSQQES